MVGEDGPIRPPPPYAPPPYETLIHPVSLRLLHPDTHPTHSVIPDLIRDPSRDAPTAAR